MNEDSNPIITILDNSRCLICGQGDDEDLILICDAAGCQNEIHLYCMNPPLTQVPENDWYCPECDKIGEKNKLLDFLSQFDYDMSIMPHDSSIEIARAKRFFLLQNNRNPLTSWRPSHANIQYYLSEFDSASDKLIGCSVIFKDYFNYKAYTGRIINVRKCLVMEGRFEHLIQFKRYFLSLNVKSLRSDCIFFSGEEDRNEGAVRWVCLDEIPCAVAVEVVWVKLYGYPWWPALQYCRSGMDISDSKLERPPTMTLDERKSLAMKINTKHYSNFDIIPTACEPDNSIHLWFYCEETTAVMTKEEAAINVVPYLDRPRDLKPSMKHKIATAIVLANIELEEREAVARACKLYSVEDMDTTGSLIDVETLKTVKQFSEEISNENVDVNQVIKSHIGKVLIDSLPFYESKTALYSESNTHKSILGLPKEVDANVEPYSTQVDGKHPQFDEPSTAKDQKIKLLESITNGDVIALDASFVRLSSKDTQLTCLSGKEMNSVTDKSGLNNARHVSFGKRIREKEDNVSAKEITISTPLRGRKRRRDSNEKQKASPTDDQNQSTSPIYPVASNHLENDLICSVSFKPITSVGQRLKLMHQRSLQEKVKLATERKIIKIEKLRKRLLDDLAAQINIEAEEERIRIENESEAYEMELMNEEDTLCLSIEAEEKLMSIIIQEYVYSAYENFHDEVVANELCSDDGISSSKRHSRKSRKRPTKQLVVCTDEDFNVLEKNEKMDPASFNESSGYPTESKDGTINADKYDVCISPSSKRIKKKACDDFDDQDEFMIRAIAVSSVTPPASKGIVKGNQGVAIGYLLPVKSVHLHSIKDRSQWIGKIVILESDRIVGRVMKHVDDMVTIRTCEQNDITAKANKLSLIEESSEIYHEYLEMEKGFSFVDKKSTAGHDRMKSSGKSSNQTRQSSNIRKPTYFTGDKSATARNIPIVKDKKALETKVQTHLEGQGKILPSIPKTSDKSIDPVINSNEIYAQSDVETLYFKVPEVDQLITQPQAQHQVDHAKSTTIGNVEMTSNHIYQVAYLEPEVRQSFNKLPDERKSISNVDILEQGIQSSSFNNTNQMEKTQVPNGIERDSQEEFMIEESRIEIISEKVDFFLQSIFGESSGQDAVNFEFSNLETNEDEKTRHYDADVDDDVLIDNETDLRLHQQTVTESTIHPFNDIDNSHEQTISRNLLQTQITFIDPLDSSVDFEKTIQGPSLQSSEFSLEYYPEIDSFTAKKLYSLTKKEVIEIIHKTLISAHYCLQHSVLDSLPAEALWNVLQTIRILLSWKSKVQIAILRKLCGTLTKVLKDKLSFLCATEEAIIKLAIQDERRKTSLANQRSQMNQLEEGEEYEDESLKDNKAIANIHVDPKTVKNVIRHGFLDWARAKAKNRIYSYENHLTSKFIKECLNAIQPKTTKTESKPKKAKKNVAVKMCDAHEGIVDQNVNTFSSIVNKAPMDEEFYIKGDEIPSVGHLTEIVTAHLPRVYDSSTQWQNDFRVDAHNDLNVQLSDRPDLYPPFQSNQYQYSHDHVESNNYQRPIFNYHESHDAQKDYGEPWIYSDNYAIGNIQANDSNLYFNAIDSRQDSIDYVSNYDQGFLDGHLHYQRRFDVPRHMDYSDSINRDVIQVPPILEIPNKALALREEVSYLLQNNSYDHNVDGNYKHISDHFGRSRPPPPPSIIVPDLIEPMSSHGSYNSGRYFGAIDDYTHINVPAPTEIYHHQSDELYHVPSNPPMLMVPNIADFAMIDNREAHRISKRESRSGDYRRK